MKKSLTTLLCGSLLLSCAAPRKSASAPRPTEKPIVAFMRKAAKIGRLTHESPTEIADRLTLCGSKFQENLDTVADVTLDTALALKREKIRFRTVQILNDLGEGVHGSAPMNAFRETMFRYALARDERKNHRAAVRKALGWFFQKQAEMR